MRHESLPFWFLLLIACSSLVCGRGRVEHNERHGKLLSIFQIVNFPNDACDSGDSAKNGTCFTAEECRVKGGTASTSCAQGYGVCCIITVGCGSSSAENCTYFDSTSTPTSGRCSARICPCSTSICQLRLDFNSFVIAGPSTTTASVTLGVAPGLAIDPAGTISLSANSQCLTDRFDVTSNTQSTPTICGTNTGEHLYVDSAPQCNDLVFQLGNAGIDTTIPTRQFSIKITQYSCDDPNLAPRGCTQYFFGQTTSTVRTFNYNNGDGQHLANQDQTICVRRERGNCRICWYANNVADFAVSGTFSKMIGFNSKGQFCCGYSTTMAANIVKGYDCVNIPGAEKATGGTMLSSNFCGRSNGLVTRGTVSSSTTGSKSICSNRTPFYIRFRSDTYEYHGVENNVLDKGFQLGYTMDNNNC